MNAPVTKVVFDGSRAASASAGGETIESPRV